jgi:hypothetical protein
MPFPEGWPPKATSTFRSVRVFASGTTTANYSDNAWLFGSFPSANQPLPYVAPGSTAPVVIPSVWGGGRDPHDTLDGVPLGVPSTACRFFRIYNDGTGVIQVSFDGTNVHDEVYANEVHEYEDRAETGVSLRIKPASSASDFRVVGW